MEVIKLLTNADDIAMDAEDIGEGCIRKINRNTFGDSKFSLASFIGVIAFLVILRFVQLCLDAVALTFLLNLFLCDISPVFSMTNLIETAFKSNVIWLLSYKCSCNALTDPLKYTY